MLAANNGHTEIVEACLTDSNIDIYSQNMVASLRGIKILLIAFLMLFYFYPVQNGITALDCAENEIIRAMLLSYGKQAFCDA